jgi:hypothetical protein
VQAGPSWPVRRKAGRWWPRGHTAGRSLPAWQRQHTCLVLGAAGMTQGCLAGPCRAAHWPAAALPHAGRGAVKLPPGDNVCHAVADPWLPAMATAASGGGTLPAPLCCHFRVCPRRCRCRGSGSGRPAPGRDVPPTAAGAPLPLRRRPCLWCVRLSCPTQPTVHLLLCHQHSPLCGTRFCHACKIRPVYTLAPAGVSAPVLSTAPPGI